MKITTDLLEQHDSCFLTPELELLFKDGIDSDALYELPIPDYMKIWIFTEIVMYRPEIEKLVRMDCLRRNKAPGNMEYIEGYFFRDSDRISLSWEEIEAEPENEYVRKIQLQMIQEILKNKQTRYPEKEDGHLTGYVFPGGYEMTFVRSDGSVLCYECADASRIEWKEVLINYEGPTLHCDNCNRAIEAEYPIEDY